MAMMISKFHKLVQSKKVWGAFAVLISIAFVFTFSPGSSGNKASRDKNNLNAAAGSLFGEEVTKKEYYKARDAIIIMGNLYQSPPTKDRLNELTWQRLAILEKAEEMGISVTTEQVHEGIRSIPIFSNPQTGVFSQEYYDYVLQQLQITSEMFQDIARESLIVDEVVRTIAVPGAMVSDTELTETYHLYNDNLTVQYADIPRSVIESPELTMEDAGTYFTNNIQQFRNPEQVKVHYVAYPAADYTNDVVVTEIEMTNVYEQVKFQRYLLPFPEDAPEEIEPQYQPYDEVKDELATEIALYKGGDKAASDAQRFVSRLARENATFESVAEDTGREIVKNLPRFAIDEIPRGIDETAPFARQAFGLELTPERTRYYSNPVVGNNFVYVIALQERFESFLPPFDAVQDRALEQAMIAASEKAYVEKANEIHADTQTALQAGMTFEDAAVSLDLQVETMEPFSVNTAPQDELGYQIAQATALLGEGSLANLIPTVDTYVLAYVTNKVPAEVPALTSNDMEMLRMQMRSIKARRIADAWQISLMDTAQLEDLMTQVAEE